MNNGTDASDHTLHFILTTLYTHSLSQGPEKAFTLYAVHESFPHKTGLEGKIRPDRPD